MTASKRRKDRRREARKRHAKNTPGTAVSAPTSPAAPAPTIRMSEVIAHVAEPLLEQQGHTVEAMKRVIALTVAAWNLTLLPADRREEEIHELCRGVFDGTPEGMTTLRETYRVVSERKRRFYPDLNRQIIDVQFTRKPGNNLYFEVAYELS